MITIELPFPPSVNGYWRAIKRGKGVTQILSERGREYRSKAKLAITLQTGGASFDGPVAVHIDLHRGDRTAYDIDNYVKAILDGITHAGLWIDDEQVERLSVNRCQVMPRNGRAIVTIHSLDKTPSAELPLPERLLQTEDIFGKLKHKDVHETERRPQK